MTCSVEGCGRPVRVHLRGWCSMHYHRWQRTGDPTGLTSKPPRDTAERFWEKVDRSGGPDACWPWTASTSSGYGVFANYPRRGRNTAAHRMAYVLTYGPLSDGLFACHHCDNRPCCNPAHLFAGTATDNNRDMWAKGRGWSPLRDGSLELKERIRDQANLRRKSHCIRGHEFSQAAGRQYCKVCRALRKRQRRAAAGYVNRALAEMARVEAPR